MEDLKTQAADISKNIKEYVDTYYKLAIIKFTDKATGITANALAAFSVLFLGIFVLFFGGVALALWLGTLVESEALGFLIVAGFFLLIIIILVLMKKQIVFPMIRNKIIRRLYE